MEYNFDLLRKSKKRSITTKIQMATMQTFLKSNKSMMLSRPKRASDQVYFDTHWNILTQKLNELGPPQRTKQEWQQVWRSQKSSLKRKRRERRTTKRNSTLPAIDLFAQNDLNMSQSVVQGSFRRNYSMQDSSVPSLSIDDEMPSTSNNVHNVSPHNKNFAMQKEPVTRNKTSPIPFMDLSEEVESTPDLTSFHEEISSSNIELSNSQTIDTMSAYRRFYELQKEKQALEKQLEKIMHEMKSLEHIIDSQS